MKKSKENIYPTEFESESLVYARLSIKYKKDKFDKKALLLVEGAARSALTLVTVQLSLASSNLEAFEVKQARELKVFKDKALADVIASKVKADNRLIKAEVTALSLVKRQNF